MLRLTRGDTVDWKFQRKYCDGTVITQAPTNMTFTMRLSPDGAIAIQKSTSGGGITYKASDKTWHVKMTSAETQALTVGEYGYDIQVEDENYTKTIALDKIKVIADYTYTEVSA